MSDETISPLRRRMIEDMAVRNFNADTQRNYIRGVKSLGIFLRRSPDTATHEELRLFQLHLTENRVRPPTTNATVTALRFLFNVTIDRPDVTRPLTFVQAAEDPLGPQPRGGGALSGGGARRRSQRPMARACACRRWQR